MIITMKIKAEYLDLIKNGQKRMEFRQFLGNDTIMLEDERGRKQQVRIKAVHEASDDLAKSVREQHRDIKWDDTEPIIVFKIEAIGK